MIYLTILFFTSLGLATAQPQAQAPNLVGVCGLYREMFGTYQFTDIASLNIVAGQTLYQRMNMPEDSLPKEILKSTTVQDFMEKLYMPQQAYCARSDVIALIQSVYDGTHPNAEAVYDTAMLEVIEVIEASRLAAEGRRNLGNPGMYPAGVAAGMKFPPTALLIGGILVTTWLISTDCGKKSCRRMRRALTQGQGSEADTLELTLSTTTKAIKRLLNAETSTEAPTLAGFSVPSFDLTMVSQACNGPNAVPSFVCTQPLSELSQAMLTSLCGGIATGLVCNVDFAQLTQVAIGAPLQG